MSKGGLRRVGWIRSVLNRLYNSALEERKDTWEPAPQKLIYCESGRIGPYFPDFSANRTTMHLKIEKLRPRFPTFSLRSFLPRRLLGEG